MSNGSSIRRTMHKANDRLRSAKSLVSRTRKRSSPTELRAFGMRLATTPGTETYRDVFGKERERRITTLVKGDFDYSRCADGTAIRDQRVHLRADKYYKGDVHVSRKEAEAQVARR